jgi:guanine deaminase
MNTTPAETVRAAHRGAVLHFLDDPGADSPAGSYEYFEDGLLLIDGDGTVIRAGAVADLLPTLDPLMRVVDHAGKLIVPGFIDTHIHFPQTGIVGCGGTSLLDWLDHHTFPAERRFGDPVHARQVAEFFLAELLRNGTTTAQVFGTVHSASVDAFFAAAQARGLRMIAGKSLMDRNCPPDLQDTAADGERDTRDLIARWHGKGRLGYAITVRFAPTSSEEQLASAGRLAAEFPDVHVQSHLAENVGEVDWVGELFPQDRSYTAVYERHGLLRPRATYAHCIHLDDADRRCLAGHGAVAAFCPTSNLYLGSGLFDPAAADATGLHFSIATDVGAGTSFSLLRTLDEACKVARLQSQSLSSLRAFYLLTLGNARSLQFDNHIGSFQPGREADFVVIDPRATPMLGYRVAQCGSLSEVLQALIVLGDDRAIAGTYVMGQRVPVAPNDLEFSRSS